MKLWKQSYGSISTSRIKQFLLFFDQTDRSWIKRLHGFTHISIGYFIHEDTLIYFDPLISKAQMDVIELPSVDEMTGIIALKIVVESKRKDRLVGLKLQSCTTLIQYIAGISLGALTPDGLYDVLTSSDKDYLLSQGILEVEPWQGISVDL